MRVPVLRAGLRARLRDAKRSLRRIRHDTTGAAAVESAIIFPILTLLVMGMLEFGVLFYTLNTMQSATRDVGRQIAVNFVDASAAETMVRERVPEWSRDSVTVTVTESNPGTPEDNVITVRATLTASDATPLDFLVGTVGDFTLDSEVVMKQEMPMGAPEP